MSASAVPIQPTWYIEYAHTEEVYQAVSSLTIDPIKHVLYYVFPFLKTYVSGHTELIRGVNQEDMLPEHSKRAILQELHSLAQAAGIRGKVRLYTALNHSFSSSGGRFSFTDPGVFVPYHRLYRPNRSIFTEERQEEHLEGTHWHYSDDEMRFLIGRELAQIKSNNGLLRIAAKVAFLSAFTLFYTHPFGWLISTVIAVSFVALYVFAERYFENRADLRAVQIVGQRLHDEPRAARAAIHVFEKMRRQNIQRRAESKFCRLYIDKQGENYLDWFHSSFAKRIALLKSRFPQAAGAPLTC